MQRRRVFEQCAPFTGGRGTWLENANTEVTGIGYRIGRDVGGITSDAYLQDGMYHQSRASDIHVCH